MLVKQWLLLQKLKHLSSLCIRTASHEGKRIKQEVEQRSASASTKAIICREEGLYQEECTSAELGQRWQQKDVM